MVSRGIIVEKKEYSVDQTDPEEDLVYVDSKTRSTKKYQLQQKFKQDQKRQSKYYTKYKVRVPLIHGASGDASAIADSDLPYCTFCPLPGSQITQLNVGDSVYVAIVDFRFDELVILGCIPKNQYSSESGTSLERIQLLEMDPNAPATFSEKIQIGYGDNPITYKNLECLQGFEEKLTEITWGTDRGGTGVSLSSKDDEEGKQKIRDNLGLYSTVILSQSEFDALTSYQKNTVYYVYENNQDTIGKSASDSKTKNLNMVQ